MKRTAVIRRTAVKRRNPKRKASEFKRCYHSKERVEWVKSLPCATCRRFGRTENAHVENGGMGRKADYDKIAPLCSRCHFALDVTVGRSAFEKYWQVDVFKLAAETQLAWLAHTNNQEDR